MQKQEETLSQLDLRLGMVGEEAGGVCIRRFAGRKECIIGIPVGEEPWF
jgi:hypothetical protein